MKLTNKCDDGLMESKNPYSGSTEKWKLNRFQF